jgi:hypothetical protein
MMLAMGPVYANSLEGDFNYESLFRDQNYKPGQTLNHSQRTLSKGVETDSWQCQAMASYSHWSAPLQHCGSHPC